MIDLNAIQIFVKVIEAEGFSGASRALALPKSTLSRKVQELEVSLGTPLVHRNTRGVTLTEAGRSFYERCRQIIAQVAAAVEDTQSESADLRGLLRLTAPVGIGQSLVQPSLTQFLAQHPKLRAELVLTDERMNVVRDGFDLALRMGDLADSELRVRRLAVFERILCASPAYVATSGEPHDPDELAGHACIVIRREPASWELEGAGGSVRVPVSWRLCTNNITAIRAAALEGGGIAALPVHLIRDDLQACRLVRVMAAWRPPATALSALFPAGPRGSPSAKAFTDHLADHLSAEMQASSTGQAAVSAARKPVEGTV